MEDKKTMKIFLIIPVIILIFTTAGCAKKDSIAQAAETASPITGAEKTPADASKAAEQIKHTVTTFDLEGMNDDGSKKWDVKGKSAESITENQVKLNDVTASSYGKDAQATITADTGMYDKEKSNVRLEQNVKAVIENSGESAGDFLAAPAAVAEKTQKAKKTKTVITCDAEVEFNYEENEGYFNKNVHVVNDEGTIDSDKLTVYLDKSTKAVKTIVAEGNVKIQRGENITYSEKATYIEAEKKIVLTGSPKIVMYQEGNFQTDFMKPAKNSEKK